MASVWLANGKWVGRVRRFGVNRAKTFLTREEAETWASAVEREARIAGRDGIDAIAKALVGRWQQVDAHRLQRFDLEQFCGVYFLFLRRRIVYVGQSVNVLRRIEEHFTRLHYDAWAWLPVPRAELDAAERHFIKKHQPPYNATYTDRGYAVATRNA